MNRKTMGLLASGALVAAVSVVGVAAPSQADLVTQCIGEGGDVTVPGDLVVPDGESCVLDGTVISGDIEVSSGADLIADDVSVSGTITGAEDAYVELQTSEIAGEVALTDAFGSRLQDSNIAGHVQTETDDRSTAGFIFAFGSDISGDVTSRDGEMMVEDAQITGAVSSEASVYTEVHNSFIDGDLLVAENQQRSTVCGAVVQGAGQFTANAAMVQIGSDGPASECTTANYWGDTVTVDDNDAAVYVDNNTINDSMTLTNNSPSALLGKNNMVRGQISGDYDDWDGAEPDELSGVAVQATPMTRDANLDDRADERQRSAEERAAEIGEADLAG